MLSCRTSCRFREDATRPLLDVHGTDRAGARAAVACFQDVAVAAPGRG